MVVKLQLFVNECLQYFVGQYVEFILKDGLCCSYLMVNVLYEEGLIELYICYMLGGKFIDYVFGVMKECDILCFEGLFGMFFLCEDFDKLIVLFVLGIGFVLIKVIIEYVKYLGIMCLMMFYWGVCCKKDIYFVEFVEQWVCEILNFKYVLVFFELDDVDQWMGCIGFVYCVVIEDLFDLFGYQVYVCGVLVMVEFVQCDFMQYYVLLVDEFYVDLFMSVVDFVYLV